MRPPGEVSSDSWKAARSGATSLSMTTPPMSSRSMRERGDLLRLGRVDELADGVLRPRRLAARERGHRAEAGEPHALRLHVESASRSRTAAFAMAGPSSSCDRRGPGRRSPRSRGRAGRRTARRSFMSVVMATPQPAPTAPEPLAVGDAHVGEVDLVEVRGAGDLLDRPHLDARRLHGRGRRR